MTVLHLNVDIGFATSIWNGGDGASKRQISAHVKYTV